MTLFGSGFEAGYRADGLRAYKHAFTSGNEASGYTYYLYDGGNAVCELDDEGDLVNTNIYAPDGLVASRTSGETTTYYLFDHQGNTSGTLIGSTVDFHLAYNAWG